MEYMKKKQHYKTNKIDPCIKPEVEFQITSEDIKLLKKFRKGGRDIYNYRTQPTQSLNSIKSGPKPRFPSSLFPDDPRVNSIEKTKKVFDQPDNMYMFEEESNDKFTQKRSTNQIHDSRGFSLNDVKYNPRIDPRMDPGVEKYNPRDSQYYIPKETLKYCTDPDPRTLYVNSNKSPLVAGSMIHKSSQVTSELDKVFEIQHDIQSRHNQIQHQSMNQSLSQNPNQKLRKGLDTSDYVFKRFNTEEVDVPNNSQLESDLLRGMPTYRTRNRSYGYRNPSENYYDYIDCDFQNSDNTVESWLRGGESTRLDNKFQTKNRNYTREVL
jgi:hypothetical protein